MKKLSILKDLKTAQATPMSAGKFFYLCGRLALTPLICLMMLAIACTDDPEPQPEPEPEPDPADPAYVFRSLTDSLHSKAKGDTLVFTITSRKDALDAPFEASEKPEWATVEIEDSTVTVIFAPNPVKVAREGDVILKQGDSQKTIAVTLDQNALKTTYRWELANTPLDADKDIIRTVAYVENDPNTLFALCITGGNRVLKSTDGGKNWSVINDNYREVGGYNMSANERYMYFPTASHGLIVDVSHSSTASTGNRVYVTNDGGLSWEHKIQITRSALVIPKDSEQPVFLAEETSNSVSQGYLWISRTREWTGVKEIKFANYYPSSNDRPTTCYANKDYAYFGFNTGVILRTATNNLFEQGWNEIDFDELSVGYPVTATSGVRGVKLLQEAGGALYCFFTNTTDVKKILKSTDRGETWQEIADIPQAASVSDMTVFGDGSGFVNFAQSSPEVTLAARYANCYFDGSGSVTPVPMPAGTGPRQVYGYDNQIFAYDASHAVMISAIGATSNSGNALVYLEEDPIDEEAEEGIEN